MTGLEEIIEAIVRRVVREELAALAKPAGGLVSIAEYAAAHSVSPATVRAAIKRKQLAVVMVGRAWRVRADAEIADPGKPGEDEAAYAARVLDEHRARVAKAGGR